MDFINFVGVALTFATIGFGGYALIRFVNLKFRRLEGGTPSAEVLAELDDLRVRVQELEGDRAMLAGERGEGAHEWKRRCLGVRCLSLGEVAQVIAG